MTNKPLPYTPSQTEKPPQDEAEVRAMHEANRAGWNEGAISYTQAIDETIAFIRGGKSNLHPVERQNLGSQRVTGSQRPDCFKTSTTVFR